MLISLQVIAQLFDKLDLDHDGRISFGEFLHLFQNVRPGKGDGPLESEVCAMQLTSEDVHRKFHVTVLL